MTALLERARSLGIHLWAEDGKLRFDAPKGAIDDQLRADLVAHKAELIELLTGPSPTETPVARPHWPTLATVRWGLGTTDPGPGLDVHPPHREPVTDPLIVERPDPFDRLTRIRQSRWGTCCRSDPAALAIELFGPPS